MDATIFVQIGSEQKFLSIFYTLHTIDVFLEFWKRGHMLFRFT